MLASKLLKNHAGLQLEGDYLTLRLLHELVHDVNERSPLIKFKDDGALLAFAGELRKAYAGHREIVPAPPMYAEIGPRYGVKLLWPTLLVQQRTMRASLAYIDHGKRHQAMVYALEACIEDCLRADFGSQAPEIIGAWQRLDPVDAGFEDRLDSRAAIFCSWTKAQRRDLFGCLLASFAGTYESTYALRMSRGDKHLIGPHELLAWENREWPDPRW